MKFFYLVVLTSMFCLNGFSQTQPSKKQDASFKVAVKFTSIASGVPDEAPVLRYIQQFKRKYKIKTIAYYKVGPLGREGEYDMAFKLLEMSPAKRAIFIKGLNNLANLNNTKTEGKLVIETTYSIDKNALPARASVEKFEI